MSDRFLGCEGERSCDTISWVCGTMKTAAILVSNPEFACKGGYNAMDGWMDAWGDFYLDSMARNIPVPSGVLP